MNNLSEEQKILINKKIEEGLTEVETSITFPLDENLIAFEIKFNKIFFNSRLSKNALPSPECLYVILWPSLHIS
jgi:hypothetical protein